MRGPTRVTNSRLRLNHSGPIGVQALVTSWAIPIPIAKSGGAIPNQAADPSLAETVAAAVQGDERGFERLYRTHVGRVYALALRLADNGSHADQLTQDVFVRAWERLATFKGESSFATWLHRLAINLFVSDRRSASRHGRRISESDESLDLAPDVNAVNPGLRLDLDGAIAALPRGARTVFVLHDVEGYQHGEIAQLTGIAVGTSKAQLFRARRLLRQALDR